MNLVVIGLNHRTAPVEVRERVAVPRGRWGAVSAELRKAGLYEAVVVSTCNRVEVYGVAGEVAAARRFFSVPPQHLYEWRDQDCVRHLCEVVCGLDSMVLGETEVLGQVKQAYEAAQTAGATGPVLNRLFQKAFAAAKHVRSRTAIARGSTSVGNVAVDLAEKIFRNLAARTVMVVGTGEISEATARALRSRGAGTILVCSRAQGRAVEFAAQIGGRAISYEDWPAQFPIVDIVITATGAPHPVITTEKLRPLLRHRPARPLFLIDIAVPRNVEPSCGELEDVFLYDLDDLQQIAQDNRAARERELDACRELIDGHLVRYLRWFAAHRPSLEQRYQP